MLRYSATVRAVVLGLILCARPVGAQDAQPPATPPDQPTDQPKIVEKARRYIENNRIVERLSDDGFYPRLGGLNSGSGLAGGAGYRRHLKWVFADISGAISTKVYLGADVKGRWLQLGGERLELWTEYQFRDDTKNPYYGLGLASSPTARVNYAIQTHDFVARVIARPLSRLRVSADAGYFTPGVRRGRDSSTRSIEDVFNDATAPGLTRQPKFVHNSVSAEVDLRDVKGFPRRGGVYRAAYELWNDRTLDRYDFRRLDLEGAHFFAVAPKDVIAVRLSLSYTNTAAGSRIPFYLLPFVGGGDTVRGFREFRFRGENAGVFSAELRHQVHSMVEVAAFVDAGKVAQNREDIVPKDLKGSYGAGIRAGTTNRLFFRFDVASGGDEGTRVVVKFTPAF